jgi:hypothetical protein
MKIMKKKLYFLFASVLFLACGTGEPGLLHDEYVYILRNTSSHNIVLKIFYKNSNNIQKDSIINFQNQETRFSFINQINVPAFGLPCDSATITFDNVKRITFHKNDGNPRNILDLKNYTGGETGEHYFEYLYKITEEDYANAIPIK